MHARQRWPSRRTDKGWFAVEDATGKVASFSHDQLQEWLPGWLDYWVATDGHFYCPECSEWHDCERSPEDDTPTPLWHVWYCPNGHKLYVSGRPPDES